MGRPTADLGIFVLIALVPLSSAAAAEPAPALPEAPVAREQSWIPLAPGHRWAYRYARERARTQNGVEEVVESLRGVLVEEVVGPAEGFGPEALLLRSRLRGRAEGGAADTLEVRRRVLDAKAPGLRLLGREGLSEDAGSGPLVALKEPLQLVRGGVGRGETWPVGVDRDGNLRTERIGRLVGIQSADTPAGVFENCRVVRTVGHIEGSVQLYGERIEVRGGRIQATEWYAPGVGLVLAKLEIDQTLELSNGASLEFRERRQFALKEVHLGDAATPAAPAPSADPEPDYEGADAVPGGQDDSNSDGEPAPHVPAELRSNATLPEQAPQAPSTGAEGAAGPEEGPGDSESTPPPEVEPVSLPKSLRATPPDPDPAPRLGPRPKGSGMA